MGDSTERTSRLSLAGLRENYQLGELSEENCRTNPLEQFEDWFKQAQAADLKEPNAMVLATATAEGRPSARVVLLKEVCDIGFVFYTSHASRKGKELGTNPFCALTFYWAELERQVRVEGRVQLIPRSRAEVYFRSRPRGSRLGALASKQSEWLPNRQILEKKLTDLEAQYAGSDDIPMPESWGGYLVVPETIEFWQGRPNRLHDRIRYKKDAGGNWTVERLSP